MIDEGEPQQPDAGRRPPTHRTIACVETSDIAQIESRLGGGDFVWLNLNSVADDHLDEAGTALGLHPLTIEDLQEFEQRAKVEEYPEYVYVVAYAATSAPDEDGVVEVHLVYSPDYLLTASAEPLPELVALHSQTATRNYRGNELLHGVLDAIVDSYGPMLDDIDKQLESLEEKVTERDLQGREIDIHEVRRTIGRINRLVHRQSEAFTRLPEALRRLPDHDPENVPYFRDIQDHLVRLTDAVDGLRDRVAGVFELYLAALNNRQNVIMKQFTIIAGIFLPLSVVTGFFGMNFGWMVREIETRGEFLAYGVGIPVFIFVGLLLIIRSRGLFDD